MQTFQCTLPTATNYEIYYKYTSDCGGEVEGMLAEATAEKTVPIKCNGKCIADFSGIAGDNIIGFKFQ